MKRLPGVVLAALMLAGASQAADAPRVDGIFEGQLMQLHLVLHLKSAPDGVISATLDSPDQGASGITADRVTLSGDTLRVTFPTIRGAYVGRFVGGRDSLDGLWSQGGGAMALRMHRVEKAYAPPRPQNPAEPLPYDADSVRVASRAAGVSLAGTFTHPRTPGPWPAMLLITGSGAQDRDESIAGHKPFLVIADHLTRQGFAVLRVDDRGTAASSGDHGTATTVDFADDAAGAVAWLRARKGVDAKRVGLIGHSEGGVIAPLVAAKDPTIACIVMLAGIGVPGDSVLVTQSAAIIRAMGGDDDAVAANHATQRRLFAAMRSQRTQAELQTELEDIVRERYDAIPAAQRPDPESARRMIRDEAARSASPWMRAFIGLDPRVALAKVKCPVLVMNGTLDLQVLPDVNVPAIEGALARGGNKRVTVKRLDGLNHLFQHANTGSLAEYATITETFAPEALTAMSDWLRVRCGMVVGR